MSKSLISPAESAVRLDGADRCVVGRQKVRGPYQKGVTRSDVSSLKSANGEDCQKGGPDAATVDAVQLIPETISHRYNNLLQTAISAADLLRCRLEQRRLSDLMPLMHRIETALGQVAALASRVDGKKLHMKGFRDDLD